MPQPCLAYIEVRRWRTPHWHRVHSRDPGTNVHIHRESRRPFTQNLRIVMELLHPQIPTAASTEDPGFEHERLDHTKPSIRLVRILPSLSSTGLIQCAISHHDIHASYTCLSYCWGSPANSHRILLNGKVFWVRENLFDFLTVVQKTLSSQTSAFYWIDAMSIDQHNILERNHQVAQMSQIFSKAKYVHLWLGSMSNLRGVLPFFLDATVVPCKVVSSHSHTIANRITNNEYWGRAWVVQELALARLVLVILPETTIALPHLVKGLRKLDLGHGNHFFTQFTTMIDGDGPDRKDIISLVSHFRNQKCSVPRDRVFSLLSLCDEGAHEFMVDYAESTANIAFNILSNSCRRPCICSITILVYSLRLQHEKRPEASVTEYDPVGPYLELDCTGLKIRGRYADYKDERSGSWRRRLSETVEWRDDACRGRCGDDPKRQWKAPTFVFEDNMVIEKLQQSSGVTFSVSDPALLIKLSPEAKFVSTINNRTKYIRGSGFTARRRDDNKEIFTVRIAFWALASWGKVADPSPDELCSRAKTLKSDYHKNVGKRTEVSSPLGLRIGYGSWDLRAAEAKK